MTRRTGKEALHTRVVQDRRDAATLRAVAAEIREAGQSPRHCGDPLCDFEDCGLAGAPGWAGAMDLQAELERLRALLARCASALEAVPDPSAHDLALLEEVRRG